MYEIIKVVLKVQINFSLIKNFLDSIEGRIRSLRNDSEDIIVVIFIKIHINKS